MTKSVGRKGVDEAEYFLSQVNSINLGLPFTGYSHETCATPGCTTVLGAVARLREEGQGRLGLLALSASPCELGGFKMAAWLTPSECIRFVFFPITPKILICPELEIREITESEVIFLICFFSPLSLKPWL